MNSVQCGTNMGKVHVLLVFSIILINKAQGRSFWDNFEQELEERLRPLNNLGPSITKRLERELSRELSPLNSLGASINQKVQADLAPLENLGARINQQVYENLKPVRDMQSAFRIQFGQDGTTVATFPGGRQFIILNNILYTCPGSISESTGKCSGQLQKLRYENKEDFCYSPSFTRFNQWYCIIPYGNSGLSFFNGQITCGTNDGSPSLLINANDFKELCGGVAGNVSYKYFTNRNLVDYGSDVRCSGNNPQICIMEKSTIPIDQYSNSFINTSGNFISIG